jgi:YHS domain-containing protein
MTRIILWAILVYILLRVGWRLFRAVLEGLGYRRQAGGADTVGLVRDPVCGTFVLPSRALTSGSGTNTRYFCSEKCRQDYSSKQ